MLGSAYRARIARRWQAHATAGLVATCACGPSVEPQPADASTSDAQTSAPDTAGSGMGVTTSATVTASDTEPPIDGSSTTGGSSTDAATSDATAASDSATGPQCVPVCDYPVECNDGEDNDDDGLVDTDDPECLTPCHNDEASTFHGFPEKGADCDPDCFWDDNDQAGDDACRFDTRCDPLGPEAEIGCAPIRGGPCDPPAPLHEDCVPTCVPMTPPGCDCFGCCTIPTPRGLEDRWMADHDCTLADPSSCAPCTQNQECVNLCDDPCEWCIGMPGPPAGCAEPTCDAGPPCESHCDCDEGFGCMLGCCRPIVVDPGA